EALGQPLDVALVEELDLDAGVALAELAQLAVLARHEPLLHHCDLEEQILLRQVEVRRERLGHATVFVPLEYERVRLVRPWDAVEVEDLRTLALGIVLEARHRRAAIR